MSTAKQSISTSTGITSAVSIMLEPRMSEIDAAMNSLRFLIRRDALQGNAIGSERLLLQFVGISQHGRFPFGTSSGMDRSPKNASGKCSAFQQPSSIADEQDWCEPNQLRLGRSTPARCCCPAG